jgi:hypothetical protein
MSAAGDPDLVNQTFEDPLGRAGFGLVDGFPDGDIAAGDRAAVRPAAVLEHRQEVIDGLVTG